MNAEFAYGARLKLNLIIEYMAGVASWLFIKQRMFRSPRFYLGIKEIKSEGKLEKSRIRKSGGGRKKVTEKQAGIPEDLERLVEPLTGGGKGITSSPDLQEHI